jgi:microcin C transport system substrate-binding protein
MIQTATKGGWRMRTEKRGSARAKQRRWFWPLHACHRGTDPGLATLALPVRAETVITSHGISTFGDLQLPADFTHLPYVNPDAPKGGEISRMVAFGSFDSFNPYAIKGNAAVGSSIMLESILTGTLDDVSASYCLLCRRWNIPRTGPG